MTEGPSPQDSATRASPKQEVQSKQALESTVTAKLPARVLPQCPCMYMTLHDLTCILRQILTQLGPSGFLTKTSVDWEEVSRKLNKPAVECEYVFWNFEPCHYRKSLGLIILDFDPNCVVPSDANHEDCFGRFIATMEARMRYLLQCIDEAEKNSVSQSGWTQSQNMEHVRRPCRSIVTPHRPSLVFPTVIAKEQPQNLLERRCAPTTMPVRLENELHSTSTPSSSSFWGSRETQSSPAASLLPSTFPALSIMPLSQQGLIDTQYATPFPSGALQHVPGSYSLHQHPFLSHLQPQYFNAPQPPGAAFMYPFIQQADSAQPYQPPSQQQQSYLNQAVGSRYPQTSYTPPVQFLQMYQSLLHGSAAPSVVSPTKQNSFFRPPAPSSTVPQTSAQPQFLPPSHHLFHRAPP